MVTVPICAFFIILHVWTVADVSLLFVFIFSHDPVRV